jgi:hypothetical protein
MIEGRSCRPRLPAGSRTQITVGDQAVGLSNASTMGIVKMQKNSVVLFQRLDRLPLQHDPTVLPPSRHGLGEAVAPQV